MFCPGCGLDERGTNQFCRACGTDLRPARKVLEMPDQITASAATAREEIGRAFASKIRDAETAVDLKIVAEDVLPKIEKFLESPEEKRLRRFRVGTTIASIGFGVALALSIAATFIKKDDLLFLAALGMVTFFIGLGFILNAFFFSVAKREVEDKSPDATRQRELDAQTTNELVLPESNLVFTSVVDNTTQHLKEKQPVRRD